MTDDFTDPDFSADDFADDKEIQKTRAEMNAYGKMIDDALAIIQKKLNVSNASHKNLKGFEMFRSLEAIVNWSLSSSDSSVPIHVSLAEYSSAYPIAKASNSGTDQYLFGYFAMTKTYPATYIHKETLKEKIADLVLKHDVDFDHSKKFSRKFHVITEDKARLLELLQFKNLDDLALYPEMELEIQGNACLFRSSRKPISVEEADFFSQLATTIINIFK